MDRRKFLELSALGGAAAVLPVGGLATTSCCNSAAADKKKDYAFKVGAITYSYRSQGSSAGDMLLYALASGIKNVELMGNSAIEYTGLPNDVPDRRYDSNTEEGKACLARFKQLGEIYRSCGVDIHILKFSPKADMSDSALDFVFDACEAIGADGVTLEVDLERAEKVAPFAEKHGKYLIFHNHGQPADADFPGFDAFLKFGKNNMLNFDAGHYFGFTGNDPCEIIEKYHDRIYSVHLKDKTSPTNPVAGNKNMPWGQGETPLERILKLLDANAGKPDWPKHADIELEYKIPEGSSSVEEVAKCLKYANNILGR